QLPPEQEPLLPWPDQSAKLVAPPASSRWSCRTAPFAQGAQVAPPQSVPVSSQFGAPSEQCAVQPASHASPHAPVLQLLGWPQDIPAQLGVQPPPPPKKIPLTTEL